MSEGLKEIGANFAASFRVEIKPGDPLWLAPSKAARERLEKLERMDAEALATALDWPMGGRFNYMDMEGEHDPVYVVMPGGAMLPLAHDAGELTDCARAAFIVTACNAALETDEYTRGVYAALVAVEAARRKWFCSGDDCTPYDHGRDEGFDFAQDAISAALRPSQPGEGWQPIETAAKDRWILAAELEHPDIQYAAYVARWHSDGYWMSKCGQNVTQSPEPTHWRPLPSPPSPSEGAK